MRGTRRSPTFCCMRLPIHTPASSSHAPAAAAMAAATHRRRGPQPPGSRCLCRNRRHTPPPPPPLPVLAGLLLGLPGGAPCLPEDRTGDPPRRGLPRPLPLMATLRREPTPSPWCPCNAERKAEGHSDAALSLLRDPARQGCHKALSRAYQCISLTHSLFSMHAWLGAALTSIRREASRDGQSSIGCLIVVLDSIGEIAPCSGCVALP